MPPRYSNNYNAACCVAWKWSLLLLLRLGSKQSKDYVGQYFDFGGGGRFGNPGTMNNNKNTSIHVQQCNVPYQTNGYDCGMHVLMTIEALLFGNTSSTNMRPNNTSNNDTSSSNNGDEHEFCMTGVNQILQQQIKNNPNYVRNLRYHIGQDIRNLVLTSSNKSNN